MKPVNIGNVHLGEGLPKICAVITAADACELAEEIDIVKSTRADIAEWRVDYFSEIGDARGVLAASNEARRGLGDIPLIFTCRTAEEGGKSNISVEDYIRLNLELINSGNIDAVDVEFSAGDSVVKQLAGAAHFKGAALIVSNHDSGAPDKAEIVSRLRRMRKLGADITKIAVTPQRFEDTLELMSATLECSKTADWPIIGVSMGELGRISRIAGQFFGSSLTFGSVRKTSAPGQLEVDDLRGVLEILNRRDDGANAL